MRQVMMMWNTVAQEMMEAEWSLTIGLLQTEYLTWTTVKENPNTLTDSPHYQLYYYWSSWSSKIFVMVFSPAFPP